MAAAWRSAPSFIPATRFVEHDGLVAVVTGVPEPFANTVYVACPPADPEQAWRRLLASVRVPVAAWLRDGVDDAVAAVARDEGFKVAEELPGMVLPLQDLDREEAAPNGLTIERICDAAGHAGYLEVVAAASGLPAERFADTAPLSSVHLVFLDQWLGRIDGRPVATAAAFRDGAEVAQIHGVCTLGNLRGKGYGRAMTLQALRGAADRGCDLAVLTATPLGLPVYRRLGFTQVDLWRTWVP